MPQPENGDIVLEAKGITKSFPGVVANDGIDLTVKAGEIHALLGENGAGKTTLVNILYGIYRQDSGEIRIQGEKVNIRSPMDARDLGVGMVHQHFMLVNPSSVAENISLGLPEGSLLFPEDQVKDWVDKYSDVYGLKVDPEAEVWQLSAGEKKTIEILKALFSGARMIILDEPTSVLTPIESRDLFSALRLMAERGKALIFITHKLNEVMSVADWVTVLRNGKLVGSKDIEETSREELARMMVGEHLSQPAKRMGTVEAKEVMKVENFSVLGDRGYEAVSDVSFEVHAGEILGVAGVAGNGQRELVEAITGLRPSVSGTVVIDGQDVTNANPRRIVSLGVAYIPEDRVEFGVVEGMSVAENLVLRKYWQEPFSSGIMLNREEIEDFAREMIDEYSIFTPSTGTPVKKLSGGNIQRLILARETSREPRLIIASHPTSGLDVKAASDIRKRLLNEAGRGASVFLDSEDLDEIFTLSDRIAVISDGQIVEILDRDGATRERVGMLMGGALS